MKITEAFVSASISSYVACIFLALTGTPPIPNQPALPQSILYALFMGLLITSIKLKYVNLRRFCGAIYGFIAMVTFAGNIQWAGGPGASLAMAIWDLCLGITLFMI
jgi:hypothetical protein